MIGHHWLVDFLSVNLTTWNVDLFCSCILRELSLKSLWSSVGYLVLSIVELQLDILSGNDGLDYVLSVDLGSRNSDTSLSVVILSLNWLNNSFKLLSVDGRLLNSHSLVDSLHCWLDKGVSCDGISRDLNSSWCVFLCENSLSCDWVSIFHSSWLSIKLWGCSESFS